MAATHLETKASLFKSKPVTYGLKTISEMTTSTTVEIVTIAMNRYQVKRRYCSQKVNAIPVGKTASPSSV
jgi:hypothetical protein